MTAGLANSLTSTLARTYAARAGEQAGPLLGKLRLGVDDAYLVVVGDSTGAASQTDSWGPRLAAWLASKFPAYTVLRYEWTVGSGYGSAVTVQTGTGAQTLHFYNGSAAGQSIQYSTTNIATLVPVTPDLVIVNHGHNNGESLTPNPPSQPGFRSVYLALLAEIRARFPRTGMLLTTQNPETSPVAGATITLHKQHAQAIAQIAAAEGMGLVDVMSAFTLSTTSGLVSGDGIHPTSAGYTLWLQTVQAEFPTSLPALSAVASPVRVLDSFLIPAGAFEGVQGSPSATYGAEDSFFNRLFSVWALGDAAVHGIATGCTIPSHWETVRISLLWTAAATTGNTVWALTVRAVDLSGGSNNITGGAKNLLGLTSTTYPGGNFTVAAPSVSQTLQKSILFGGYTIAGTLRHWLLSLRRVGDNAGDTMTGNAEVHGLLVERLS